MVIVNNAESNILKSPVEGLEQAQHLHAEMGTVTDTTTTQAWACKLLSQRMIWWI